VLGDFNEPIDFGDNDPTKIHAMCMRYNANTKELEVATDGGSFTNVGAITFDGAQSPMIFGAMRSDGVYPYGGYVGEGILSARIEDDDLWQTFWERVNRPDWYKISTLSRNDIVDVWDFGWGGHYSTEDMPVGLEHGLTFTDRTGHPLYRRGHGIYLGGMGAIELATEGLDWNEVSVIIELAGCTQNDKLDTIFSYCLADTYSALQNDFPNEELKWTCGYPNVEVAGGLTTDGVVAVSGSAVYKDGKKVGELSGLTSSVFDTDFIIGCLTTDGFDETQFMKGTIKKVLIVKRRLTDAEHAEIHANISAASIGDHDADIE
jgi:hypothetical protein